jgi:NAD(P)H-hydrate repair Nnr-like enzyme with NAD(P)H-hydrate dehydratase domain
MWSRRRQEGAAEVVDAMWMGMGMGMGTWGGNACPDVIRRSWELLCCND